MSTTIPPIVGVSTATAAFIGWSPQGHTEAAVEVENLREFAQEFGEPDARSLLGHAVRYFFENGGTHAWIVRLAAAPGVVLAPDTEPFERLLLPAGGAGGVYLLDRVALINLLCVPGETTPAIVAALQAFCLPRRIFLIADAPQGPMPFAPDPKIVGEPARNSAMYLPWMLPADSDASKIHALPPCGFVAGIYAREDRTRGVWKAPAGPEATLTGAIGPAVAVTERDVAALTEHGVNAIRSVADHIVVWGSRTLAGGAGSASEWKYVPVRRLGLFLEESIQRGLAWTTFEPNGEPLWAQVRASVTDFLFGLWRQGAFAGNTADTSFFVRCGADTMTQDDVDAGHLIILIGVAPLKPAEFVVIRIGARAGSTRT
ncbi:MAG TPA: phage tail sheath subtilisin-like domain-containing protein [Vicinamibacterales bacterium]|nr:phage tail sheath subtilisin-like domain-containing protein [Vicinamibacterales bacterium]